MSRRDRPAYASIASLRSIAPRALDAAAEPTSVPSNLTRSTTTSALGLGGVLERMQRGGWGMAADPLEPEERRPRTGSADSGYSSEPVKEESSAYLTRWSTIRKAVWGAPEPAQLVPDVVSKELPEREVDSSSPQHGARLWDQLLAVSTTVVEAGISRVRGDDEDDKVDAEGCTHLGRTIKAYHLSRAESAVDFPAWLLSEEDKTALFSVDALPLGHAPARARAGLMWSGGGRGDAAPVAGDRSTAGDAGGEADDFSAGRVVCVLSRVAAAIACFTAHGPHPSWIPSSRRETKTAIRPSSLFASRSISFRFVSLSAGRSSSSPSTFITLENPAISTSSSNIAQLCPPEVTSPPLPQTRCYYHVDKIMEISGPSLEREVAMDEDESSGSGEGGAGVSWGIGDDGKLPVRDREGGNAAPTNKRDGEHLRVSPTVAGGTHEYLEDRAGSNKDQNEPKSAVKRPRCGPADHSYDPGSGPERLRASSDVARLSREEQPSRTAPRAMGSTTDASHSLASTTPSDVARKKKWEVIELPESDTDGEATTPPSRSTKGGGTSSFKSRAPAKAVPARGAPRLGEAFHATDVIDLTGDLSEAESDDGSELQSSALRQIASTASSNRTSTTHSSRLDTLSADLRVVNAAGTSMETDDLPPTSATSSLVAQSSRAPPATKRKYKAKAKVPELTVEPSSTKFNPNETTTKEIIDDRDSTLKLRRHDFEVCFVKRYSNQHLDTLAVARRIPLVGAEGILLEGDERVEGVLKLVNVARSRHQRVPLDSSEPIADLVRQFPRIGHFLVRKVLDGLSIDMKEWKDVMRPLTEGEIEEFRARGRTKVKHNGTSSSTDSDWTSYHIATLYERHHWATKKRLLECSLKMSRLYPAYDYLEVIARKAIEELADDDTLRCRNYPGTTAATSSVERHDEDRKDGTSRYVRYLKVSDIKDEEIKFYHLVVDVAIFPDWKVSGGASIVASRSHCASQQMEEALISCSNALGLNVDLGGYVRSWFPERNLLNLSNRIEETCRVPFEATTDSPTFARRLPIVPGTRTSPPTSHLSVTASSTKSSTNSAGPLSTVVAPATSLRLVTSLSTSPLSSSLTSSPSMTSPHLVLEGEYLVLAERSRKQLEQEQRALVKHALSDERQYYSTHPDVKEEIGDVAFENVEWNSTTFEVSNDGHSQLPLKLEKNIPQLEHSGQGTEWGVGVGGSPMMWRGIEGTAVGLRDQDLDGRRDETQQHPFISHHYGVYLNLWCLTIEHVHIDTALIFLVRKVTIISPVCIVLRSAKMLRLVMSGALSTVFRPSLTRQEFDDFVYGTHPTDEERLVALKSDVDFGRWRDLPIPTFIKTWLGIVFVAPISPFEHRIFICGPDNGLFPYDPLLADGRTSVAFIVQLMARVLNWVLVSLRPDSSQESLCAVLPIAMAEIHRQVGTEFKRFRDVAIEEQNLAVSLRTLAGACRRAEAEVAKCIAESQEALATWIKQGSKGERPTVITLEEAQKNVELVLTKETNAERVQRALAAEERAPHSQGSPDSEERRVQFESFLAAADDAKLCGLPITSLIFPCPTTMVVGSTEHLGWFMSRGPKINLVTAVGRSACLDAHDHLRVTTTSTTTPLDLINKLSSPDTRREDLSSSSVVFLWCCRGCGLEFYATRNACHACPPDEETGVSPPRITVSTDNLFCTRVWSASKVFRHPVFGLDPSLPSTVPFEGKVDRDRDIDQWYTQSPLEVARRLRPNLERLFPNGILNLDDTSLDAIVMDDVQFRLLPNSIEAWGRGIDGQEGDGDDLLAHEAYGVIALHYSRCGAVPQFVSPADMLLPQKKRLRSQVVGGTPYETRLAPYETRLEGRGTLESMGEGEGELYDTKHVKVLYEIVAAAFKDNIEKEAKDRESGSNKKTPRIDFAIRLGRCNRPIPCSSMTVTHRLNTGRESVHHIDKPASLVPSVSPPLDPQPIISPALESTASPSASTSHHASSSIVASTSAAGKPQPSSKELKLQASATKETAARMLKVCGGHHVVDDTDITASFHAIEEFPHNWFKISYATTFPFGDGNSLQHQAWINAGRPMIEMWERGTCRPPVRPRKTARAGPEKGTRKKKGNAQGEGKGKGKALEVSDDEMDVDSDLDLREGVGVGTGVRSSSIDSV